MAAIPELTRIQRHLEGLDPVEVALRAIGCLSWPQRHELMVRFSERYGTCVPPIRLSIAQEASE